MNPWYWRYLKIILPKRRQISRPGPRARLHRVLLALQLLRHWLDHRTLGFRRPCCVAVMENPPSTPKNWVIYPLWPGIWTLPLIYEHLEGRYDDGNMFFSCPTFILEKQVFAMPSLTQALPQLPTHPGLPPETQVESAAISAAIPVGNIRANDNSSLTWNKVIWGWFSLLTIIQMSMYIYIYTYIYIWTCFQW